MFLLVPAYLGNPGQKAVKQLCVCALMMATAILICHCVNHLLIVSMSVADRRYRL